MKKLHIPRYIIFSIGLLIVTMSTISCNKKKENYNAVFNFNFEPIKTESTIDFNLIDSLNQSNKKTLYLAAYTFSQIKDVKTLQLLLKIKKDHQKIDSELKKLTENNLIVIPKLYHQLNVNNDSLNGKKSNFYLLKKLEEEIKNQATIFDDIANTSQNTDFKIFAQKSKKTLHINTIALENTLKPSLVNL